MSRLPTLTREELDPEAQAVWDKVAGSRGGVRGPFALLIHHPSLAERVAEVGAILRFQSRLSGADRELAILATGREVDAAYEWAAHEPIGLKEGTRPEAIAVIRDKQPTTGLLPREAVIIDIIRSLYHEHRIPDELYAQAEAEL